MIYLDDNGVTIKAKKGALKGGSYELNGVNYLVVSDGWEIHKILDAGGDVSKIVTTYVTNLSPLQYVDKTNFNQDISSWDVSRVTSAIGLFKNAKIFNQNIGYWDVSRIRTMQEMFKGATLFNQPLGKWNTKNVETFISMFEDATSFNQPIGDWDLSKAVNMMFMFKGASAFNQPIGGWDVSNAHIMSHFFSGASSFNQDISNWNVKDTSVNCFFEGASSFNRNISNWEVSGSLNRMFKDAISFDQPLDKWNMKSVNNISEMFMGAESFNQNISNWDVSKITSMASLFKKAKRFNQSISSWDVSKVTNMNNMFQGASAFNQDLRSWKVNKKLKKPLAIFNDADAFNSAFSPFSLDRAKPVKKLDEINLDSQEKKVFPKLKKLLLSRNCDQIDTGIELLRSLNSKKIFEVLLSGSKIKKSLNDPFIMYLEPNKFFTGTLAAQILLDYALYHLISISPQDIEVHNSLLLKNIESLSVGNSTLTYNDKLKIDWKSINKFPFDKFTHLKKLVLKVNGENLNNYSSNTVNDLFIYGRTENLDFLKNFPALEVFSIDSYVLNNINGIFNCKQIKKLSIRSYELSSADLTMIKKLPLKFFRLNGKEVQL